MPVATFKLSVFSKPFFEEQKKNEPQHWFRILVNNIRQVQPFHAFFPFSVWTRLFRTEKVPCWTYRQMRCLVTMASWTSEIFEWMIDFDDAIRLTSYKCKTKEKYWHWVTCWDIALSDICKLLSAHTLLMSATCVWKSLWK